MIASLSILLGTGLAVWGTWSRYRAVQLARDARLLLDAAPREHTLLRQSIAAAKALSHVHPDG